jgi:LacI family transcriptional regulator
MARLLHVALIVETSINYGRRILRGITRYTRAHGGWSIFLEQRDLLADPPGWLHHWRGDGIICRLTTPQLARQLRRRRISVVDLNDIHADLGLPRIRCNDRTIGELAAEHLMERGFRHFAFCGFSEQDWSVLSKLGFLDRLQRNGYEGAVYESPWYGPRAHPWEQEQDAIASWLTALTHSTGVMACNDMRGQHVLDACQRIGRAVPEDLAVIGVDDDELLCELCNPPLSSVIPCSEKVGYEAAALLDRLMAGATAAPETRWLEPLGVRARQSTDILAIEDPQVAAAVRYIREHACQGVTVDEVLRQVPLSRTTLERQFRKFLGRTPQEEIRAVQLKRVKQLLAETDWSLEQIGRLAGYEHPEYMSVMFKREMGLTPGGYRRAVKAASGNQPGVERTRLIDARARETATRRLPHARRGVN